MKLFYEESSFTNSKGEKIVYLRYFVVVYGVKIYVKPLDSTSNQMLSVAVESGDFNV